MEKYDLIVIGSGPAGEKAAVKAAYFKHKVALVERESGYGGSAVNAGLSSKTLKETALYLSGKFDKGLYGIDRNIAGEANIENFMYRKNLIIKEESKAIHQNLLRHKIDIYSGSGTFEDAHHIRIKGPKEEVIEGDYIIIATGAYPSHPSNIPFDNQRVHDSDTILNIQRFPQSIAILGAGVIGCEYSTIFSTMGTKVFLINRSDKILPFIDQEVVACLIQHMRNDQTELLFNQSVKHIIVPQEEKLKVELESGMILEVDMFLFAAGRNGNTGNLNLEKAGISRNKRELIEVNKNYQTTVPHIYAIGDVIGFPSLASTSMDQGRVAVAHIFQTKDIEEIAQVLPYGIYTVPEISTAGISEEEAKQKGLSYAIGISRYQDLPRGKIMGAHEGLLKLVVTRDDLIIRGVHIIGHLATELIHHGVDLIEGKKTLNDVIGIVYNYPTLHSLYKYAAYDALGNIAGYKIKF